MRAFRLALAQINSTVGDLEGNSEKILTFVEEARSQGADLIAFPEMAVTGYPAEDLLYNTSFLNDNVQAMRRIVKASKGLTIILGFVDTDGDIYNSAVVGHDGTIAGIYHKMYLPTYGVFDEDRYFQKGEHCPVYIINGVRVGVNICEDIWQPLGPIVVQRELGAEVIVNINASPYYMGKQSDRERMLATRSSDNILYVAYLNTVGGQDELVFDGASLIFDPSGNLVARGKNFQEDLLITDIDVETVVRSRLRDTRTRKETSTSQQYIGSSKVITVSEYMTMERPALEHHAIGPPMCEAEEVYTALVTGTRDYVKKSGFSQVIIGLSGGIDSSLTACVAVDALGSENVVGATMPSRFSSEGSVIDSQVLADNLGIEFWSIPIEPAHQTFLHMLRERFDGTEPGLAEENLQARIRGNLLMTIANKFGWLVLTTGNKSEMAMGYATLYGDMAGGFAVLKDVPKTLVYELARWRNEAGDLPNLVPQTVLEKPPSAELRPDQKDEDSLPPYSVLDHILKAYVEEDRSHQDLVSSGLDSELVARIITTVDRNEYKRRQSPPGVKITHKAFGKDRRLPIVNRYRQF